MVFISVNSTVIGGIFCAGGKSKFGCICDAVVLWCLIIPAATLSAFYFKFPVIIVYLILCLDEVIKIPIVFWYFRRYSWVQNITRQSSWSRVWADNQFFEIFIMLMFFLYWLGEIWYIRRKERIKVSGFLYPT